MALIYKPNALYMSPKNESVDITDGITFSFVFKGYQMARAIGQLYQNSNIGEWTALGSEFSLYDAGTSYYNNSVVSKTYIPQATGTYQTILDNVNSTLGWGVTVYGMVSSQAAGANNTLTPALRGFETGNQVLTNRNYTFINNYDSKLSLGSVNSGTDADGIDLTNSFSVTQGVYLNLTTGDEIKQTVSSTSYYIYKVNEGASEPVGYYIRVYGTEAEALAGSGTAITTAVANKTFYVNPQIVTSNIFYVGVIGGNVIKLYTSKEASLQGVEEAIVPLTQGTTYTIQAFEKSPVVQFIPFIENTPYFSLDDVYGTNRGVTLTATEDENVYTYSSANTLYTGQQLTCINVNDGTTTNYVYYVRIWDTSSYTLSLYRTRSAAIGNNTTMLTLLPSTGTNTVYLSEILTTTKSFKVSWLDTTNVPLIVSWQAFLYNVDQEHGIDTLIEQSDVEYNANAEYEFNHLLLSFLSNISSDYDDSIGRYKVVFNLVDNNGYKYESVLNFDVGYPILNTNYSPIVDVDNCDSSITVDWNNAISVSGTVTGTTPTYVANHVFSGNYGTKINKNSSVKYDVEIPEHGFPTFLFNPCANFSGVIMTLDGETQRAVLSYNGGFVFAVTNKMLGTTTNIVVDTDVTTLSSSKTYLIGYADNRVYIRVYADTGSW